MIIQAPPDIRFAANICTTLSSQLSETHAQSAFPLPAPSVYWTRVGILVIFDVHLLGLQMTPGLMVLIFIAAFFGCLIFPFAWLALGFWQKRRGLKILAFFSFFAVLCPLGLYWLFFHSGNTTVAFVSLTFFIPGNIVLLLASFFTSRMLTRKLSCSNAPTT